VSRTKHPRKAKVKFGAQTFKLAKGLDPKEAFKKAKAKATREFRGFNYNSATGIAKLI
jgi:hypothetical protein